MRHFLVVLQFEMKNYLESKTYILTTALIVSLLVITLTIPAFFPNEHLSYQPQKSYALVDAQHLVTDLTVFEETVPFSKIVILDSVQELKNEVKKGTYDAGLVVNSLTDIEYIVDNTELGNKDEEGFKEAIANVYRAQQIEKAGIDYKLIKGIYNQTVNCKRVILGKDGANNYVYTYILTFIMYVIVVIHGQMIAVSITTEKSNRTMEVLVTSTDVNELIFGKVIAGTCASLLQGFIILTAGMITYNVHADAWGHHLDFIFNIPPSVLFTFALFGLAGFVFYAFIFGAMGALASRVEDVSKSISAITFIFIIVFLIGVFGMSHSDSLIIKIASFIPFSSSIVMFIRAAMGNVSLLEMDLSMSLLVAATIIVGVLGAKLYKLGTLKYDKSISIGTAIKSLFNSKKA